MGHHLMPKRSFSPLHYISSLSPMPDPPLCPLSGNPALYPEALNLSHFTKNVLSVNFTCAYFKIDQPFTYGCQRKGSLLSHIYSPIKQVLKVSGTNKIWSPFPSSSQSNGNPEFLNQGTIDIWGWRILCCGGHPLPCRMFSSPRLLPTSPSQL